MNQIKDGDYFQYSWKPSFGPAHDPQWCRDRRCVEEQKMVTIRTFTKKGEDQ